MTDRRFQRALDGWLDTIASPNTRAAYRRDLEVYAAWASDADLHPAEVTAADIGAFRDHCRAAGSGPATVNRRLAAVSSFYRHTEPRWGVSNPAATAERSPVPVSSAAAMSSAAARQVWAAAVARGGTTAVIVALVLLDGFKTKDLLVLDVGDVRWRRGVASIDGVVLSARTAVVIRSHLAGRRSGPLLTRELASAELDRLTRFGVDYLVKRVGADAGLATPLTVNALRAAHAVSSGPTC
ncbi:MAG: site-specific integrase [Actinobacteria bacterium]|nr:site-specific integrase [Actinomycetota bacterium]